MGPPQKKNPWAQVGDYASLGIMLPACAVTGYYLGVLLDHWFHTTYLNIVFLIVGVVAGMIEAVRIALRNGG